MCTLQNDRRLCDDETCYNETNITGKLCNDTCEEEDFGWASSAGFLLGVLNTGTNKQRRNENFPMEGPPEIKKKKKFKPKIAQIQRLFR